MVEAASSHLTPETATLFTFVESDPEDREGSDSPTFQLEATNDSTSAGNSIFLPLVSRNLYSIPPCSADSPFGVAIAAIHQVESGGPLLRALEQSGACWTHVVVDWSMIQPEPPVDNQLPDYNWAWYDEKLALVSNTGVRLVAGVEFVPNWARGEPFPDLRCTNISEEYLDEFGQFLTDLVSRYKEPPWDIHVWELRNEPDGTTRDRDLVGQGCGGSRPDLYAKMLEVAYPAIKSADPEAIVLMGGLAYDNFLEYGGPFYRYFPDEVMANGGGENIDATNIHYFHDFYREWERWIPQGDPPTCGDDVEDGIGDSYEAWGIDLMAKMNHFRNRMFVCHDIDRPLWVTELAEHGFPGDDLSLSQQARYVIQGTVRGLAADAVNVTWFALVTPPGDPSEQGLLAQDFALKPSFDAYQTMITELRGWDYSSTLSQPDVEGYVFMNTRLQVKVVAWASGQPQKTVFLDIEDATRLLVADRYGNKTLVDDGGIGDADGKVNGSISLILPKVPYDPEPDEPPRYSAEPLFVTKWP